MKIHNKLILVIYMIFSIISSHANDKTTSLTNKTATATTPDKCKDNRTLTELKTIDFLPDPFHFSNGEAVKKDDWNCRRSEIESQIQTFSLGVKEPAPNKTIAKLEGNLLTITIEHQGKSTEFIAEITWPTKGKAPYPAIIGIGGSWINNDQLLEQGIALIKFPNNEIAEQLNQTSRGKGKFYELYGKEHSAGALMAWAWGVSRLIDGIESTASDKINHQRLAVTGCSRNGKGALVAGAFDERIRLTLPQEAGSGGITSWRVSDAQLARGQTVQTLRQIVQENVWFRADFGRFSESVNTLPFDQHLLAGLIAPRAMMMVDNTSMEWLGNESTYTSALAAREIWAALGNKNAFGFSQQGGHDHCKLPDAQATEINHFVQKFLLDQSNTDTQIFRTDGQYKTDIKRWIPWSTPSFN